MESLVFSFPQFGSSPSPTVPPPVASGSATSMPKGSFRKSMVGSSAPVGATRTKTHFRPAKGQAEA